MDLENGVHQPVIRERSGASVRWASLRKPLSIRAGILMQLALVAAASLSLLSIFSLKVLEVTVERRHIEAGISVAEVVSRAMEKDVVYSGELSPYTGEITLLKEGPLEGRPLVVPVGDKVFPLLPIHSTVDVTLPFSPPPSASARAGEEAPRGIRVRFHSPGIVDEVRTFVNVTLVIAAINIAVLVLFGGFMLHRTVIAPIRRLAATSERIAQGDYASRAEGGAGSEVDQLAASFNKMVDAILEAQERLRRSGREVARSEKLATVGRLAAGVAHEVGSPLMAIRAYAEHLLRNRPGREESEECLNKVVSETRKIERIVQGLLSVASPGQSGHGVTDVNAVARDAINMVSFRNLFREVEVVLECGDVPAAAIMEDSLRQVLLNLVMNAVDAMERNGRLTVRTWVMEDWVPAAGMTPRHRASDPPDNNAAKLRGGSRQGVVVSVSDTGSGIPPDDLALVFDPFFTTKEPGKGTGLGLSVSKTIIEGIGGEILIESEPKEGTTVAVILPMARKEEGLADG
ncbi:MAG: ATP-binding protein [Syntrophorhabdaceae bacterium]|nr:ATP-binding protein [Syntrophorhabdaceae bacterium]